MISLVGDWDSCIYMSLNSFPSFLFLNTFSVALHCCLMAPCASITARHQIVFLQRKLLGEARKKPHSEQLSETVHSFIHLLDRKVPSAYRGKAYRVVTTLVCHSFVGACRCFSHGEWICVSGSFHCGYWLQLEETCVIHPLVAIYQVVTEASFFSPPEEKL